MRGDTVSGCCSCRFVRGADASIVARRLGPRQGRRSRRARARRGWTRGLASLGGRWRGPGRGSRPRTVTRLPAAAVGGPSGGSRARTRAVRSPTGLSSLARKHAAASAIPAFAGARPWSWSSGSSASTLGSTADRSRGTSPDSRPRAAPGLVAGGEDGGREAPLHRWDTPERGERAALEPTVADAADGDGVLVTVRRGKTNQESERRRTCGS